MSTPIDLDRLITLDTNILLAAVGGGQTFRFRRGEQYEFAERIVRLEGCGCGGVAKKDVGYYRVVVDGHSYLIREDLAHLDRTPKPPGEPNTQAIIQAGVTRTDNIHVVDAQNEARRRQFDGMASSAYLMPRIR